MTVFAQAQPAAPAKSRNVFIASLLLAAILVVMATAQLYSFPEFIVIVSELGLPGAVNGTSFWAALLVASEIGAVPFLLGMRLSPAFRVFSMMLGWLLIAGWLAIAVYVSLSGGVSNSGILGAVVELPTGVWMVYFLLGLAGLHAWVSYGRWPLGKSKEGAKHG